MAHRVIYARVHTRPGTLVRCLLDTMMVSSNHTFTLKIHEERQSLVANTTAWLVGSHTNTSCPSNITFADKHCSSFKYLCDMCNFWRTYDTASENTDYYARHNTHAMMILHYYCGWTSPLHKKLPGYSIFQDLSEIKHMRTTVCTKRFSSPLLQAGIITPGNEARLLDVQK